MARNQEKSSLMMNRWTAMKEDMSRGGEKRPERRPYLSSLVKNLPEAEKWRHEVVREITKKVSEIQNAGIGEARARDLNDEINKLVREKGHWERQIKSLGGPDYGMNSSFDSDALELPGSGGYKYFGAARDLPGIKELFDAAKEKEIRRSRGDIMRGITPDYYGFREDEDHILLRAEAGAQQAATLTAAQRWEEARMLAKAERMAKRAAGVPLDQDADSDDGCVDDGGSSVQKLGASAQASTALLAAAPAALTAEEVDALLAERKRQLLLEKYGRDL